MDSRPSFWEESEGFRDLDEIVERRPRADRSLGRLLVGAVLAAAVGLAGWHLADRGDGPRLPALGKFDQLLARHSPQRPAEPTEASPDPPAAPAPALPRRGSPAGAPAGVPDETADTEPPIGEEAAPAVPAEAPADGPAAGGYHIQVASLRSKERADLLVERLARDGHPATRQVVGLRGQGYWHTVRVGPFETRIAAELYRLRFQSLQGREAVVVPRSNGAFHVQVASLRSRDKADDLVSQLARQGHKARRRPVEVRGRGSWHSVRIGPFDTRAEAEAYREGFSAREHRNAVVIPFETPTVGEARVPTDRIAARSEDAEGDDADE